VKIAMRDVLATNESEYREWGTVERRGNKEATC
jgi:hypothetical protein